MGISIKVAIRDKVGGDFTIVEKKRIENLAMTDTERIAKECEKTIQETIMRKTEMPTGKLASAFVAESIPNGWGVGDIVNLDANVPYWNHIDKGSEGIGANWSHYLPRGYWVNGRWVESASGYLGIKPKTPITAVHYIAETLSQMESKIASLLKRTI